MSGRRRKYTRPAAAVPDSDTEDEEHPLDAKYASKKRGSVSDSESDSDSDLDERSVASSSDISDLDSDGVRIKDDVDDIDDLETDMDDYTTQHESDDDMTTLISTLGTDVTDKKSVSEIKNAITEITAKKIVPDSERITSDFLTQLELTQVIATRAAQIEQGAPVFVETDEDNAPSIAIIELREGKNPFVIYRKCDHGIERWKVREMEYFPSHLNRSDRLGYKKKLG